jgi:hypothetical protein
MDTSNVRTIKFIVNRQIIKKDPECDFGGLVPGSEGYLRAEFLFSPDWNGFAKVATFRSANKDYDPQILTDGMSCLIPKSVLARDAFKIGIIGKNQSGMLKPTNTVTIHQNGGIK